MSCGYRLRLEITVAHDGQEERLRLPRRDHPDARSSRGGVVGGVGLAGAAGRDITQAWAIAVVPGGVWVCVGGVAGGHIGAIDDVVLEGELLDLGSDARGVPIRG